MSPSIRVSSAPLSLGKNTESQVYLLLAVAMALTVVGVYVGISFASLLLSTGLHVFFLIAELVIIFTARFWIEKSPLNYVLFGLFPALSGFTLTPYILYVLAGYTNGAVILVNALATTACMTAAAAVFARTTSWNLGVMGRALFFAIIGLIIMGLLQLFIPALRSTQAELFISGAGIVIFALFTAFDLQRIMQMGKMGVNPFLMALSLYLDIFNLFLYILRFMTVMYGKRR